MLKNSALAVTAAILLPLMLTGCATSKGKLRPVNLPAPPSCMSPVTVPELQAGADARLALANHRAALKAANGRLDCSRAWYVEIRKEYAKQ